ncbi:hypothetical protein KPH14_009908 [Odynerus spinipes]|uniref:Vitellogenin domain-containing protein n=1 Tax=Odynerus spinipes TaxID=1348599 RepID=A0AAD9RTZ0_9HYME|nr:hypothetical protein KPH14_009908 [Odynerus spinipes]
MITLLLLPFFLASRISVDIESLLHGPEYTYRVEIDTINRDGRDGATTKAFDIGSTLKCRPRVPDTLNCRFEAARMAVFEKGLLDLAQDTVEDLWVDEEPFEIKFDKNGIAQLIVTRSMEPWTVDMIRAIVNQLNVGVDLRKRPDGIFVAKERSFLGECGSTIELSRSISQDRWKDDKLEIVPMPGLEKASGEILQIEKRRDLNDCGRKEDYFFASKSGYTLLHRDTTTTIKSSLSRIVVSDSNYTSYTVNEIVVGNKERNRNFTLYEKITLKLETVSAAKTELPVIPDATFVSFFVHGLTHANNDDDDDESARIQNDQNVRKRDPRGKW